MERIEEAMWLLAEARAEVVRALAVRDKAVGQALDLVGKDYYLAVSEGGDVVMAGSGSEFNLTESEDLRW